MTETVLSEETISRLIPAVNTLSVGADGHTIDERLNNQAKVTMRKSYGFRTYRVLKLALYHS